MPDRPATYECNICGWIYDEVGGDPDHGIPPGTMWEDLPENWTCPVCDAGKGDFQRVEGRAAPTGNSNPNASVVVVGSGLAGHSLVRELRRRDPHIVVTLITADGGEIYSKPMLSNALAKGQSPDDLIQRDASVFAAEVNAHYRTRTRVVTLDRTNKRIQFEDGAWLNYERLVLAIGADPKVFPVDGAADVGIATVNDLDEYRQWRKRIGHGKRILLVGAGLIGCEFANDLAAAGFEVSVVDPAGWPLARLLPVEIGMTMVWALSSLGVSFHLGRTVARYGRAVVGFQATLDDGTVLAFDHALSAVGLTPRTQLAARAGVAAKVGILVDRRLQTSDPAIFALGDCAETEAGPLPFVAPLLAQARTLAAVLTGEKNTMLSLPALPVVVKTPALPMVVCPPRAGLQGTWNIDQLPEGAVALFRTPEGLTAGFVLTESKVDQAQALAGCMPDLLPKG